MDNPYSLYTKGNGINSKVYGKNESCFLLVWQKLIPNKIEEEQNMKKIVVLMVVAVLLVALVACGTVCVVEPLPAA